MTQKKHKFIYILILINSYLFYHEILGYNGIFEHHDIQKKLTAVHAKYYHNQKILSNDFNDKDALEESVKRNSDYGIANEKVIIIK